MLSNQDMFFLHVTQSSLILHAELIGWLHCLFSYFMVDTPLVAKTQPTSLQTYSGKLRLTHIFWQLRCQPIQNWFEQKLHGTLAFWWGDLVFFISFPQWTQWLKTVTCYNLLLVRDLIYVSFQIFFPLIMRWKLAIHEIHFEWNILKY